MKLGIICLFFISNAFPKNVQIKDLVFNHSGYGKMSVKIGDGMVGNPKIKIRDNILQLTFSKAYVWPKIEKSVSIYEKFDTEMLAYQFDKDTVRVRAILPYSLKGRGSEVELSVGENNVDVVFPKKAGEIVDDFDESYLNRLINDKKAKSDTPAPAEKEMKKDVVKTTSASPNKGGFKPSPWMYSAKAAGFLVLVLLVFYGLVSVFKRGFFRRGKMGFLNGTKTIEVLNTTYVGHKRSLQLVRVHNQIFLISNTERGIGFLSEMTDKSGLLKEGERQVSGSNFDTNLGKAKTRDRDFNIKDIIEEEKMVKEKDEVEKKSREKFSDQIKNKVKNLKSLQ